MDIKNLSKKQILQHIQDEVRKAALPFVGKENIPPTSAEIAERMGNILKGFYTETDNDIKVTPTADDKIFDVSFTIPVFRATVDLNDISKKIQILTCDGKFIDCSSKSDAVYQLIDEYRENSETCIGEMLSSTEIHGLSVQDVVDVFALVMFKMENDEVTQTLYDNEDAPEIVNRWEW